MIGTYRKCNFLVAFYSHPVKYFPGRLKKNPSWKTSTTSCNPARFPTFTGKMKFPRFVVVMNEILGNKIIVHSVYLAHRDWDTGAQTLEHSLRVLGVGVWGGLFYSLDRSEASTFSAAVRAIILMTRLRCVRSPNYVLSA